jgi:tRNA-specific 2-thiouridylase
MSLAAQKATKVLVALSGGVDSAVAAALLRQQGFEVHGAHMVCWDQGPYCTSDEDRNYATKVAAFLKIPFQVFDFRKEYKERVVDYFVKEYEAGRTPNPDAACNKEIKFGIFLQKAKEMGYNFIATGHYARIRKVKVRQTNLKKAEVFQLLSGLDQEKDQSYFLYSLGQEELKHTLFPVGHLRKSEVRVLAKKFRLPNATKKDSQGICFIGNVEVKEFLRERIKSKIGNIINQHGEVIGKHDGMAFYTIGQREGVGVSARVPYYIVAKYPQTNTLVAAPFGDNSHFQNKISTEAFKWVGKPLKKGERVQIRIRYRQRLVPAKINQISGDKVEISLLESQVAVTAGQIAVIYRGEELLGGGVII